MARLSTTYSLWHVRWTSDFDVSPAEHCSVHLFKSQLSSFGYFVLHKSESFVFLGDGIPRHVDGLDWSEWKKRCANRVFFQLEGDAADVNSTRWTRNLSEWSQSVKINDESSSLNQILLAKLWVFLIWLEFIWNVTTRTLQLSTSPFVSHH